MYERALLKTQFRIHGSYCPGPDDEECDFEEELRAASAGEAVRLWCEKHECKPFLYFRAIDPLT